MKKITSFFVFLFVIAITNISFAQTIGWAYNIGSSGADYGRAIITDPSGNIFVSGSFQGTADFDPSVASTMLTSKGSNDIFIAKYSNSGALLWAKSIGGIGSDIAFGIDMDNTGNIFMTGQFSSTADFDPSVGISNQTSVGGADAFFAKYNSTGDLVWVKTFGSTLEDYGSDIKVNTAGDIFITGAFCNTIDFDLGVATANKTSQGLSDIFIAKYNSIGNYFWANSIGSSAADYGSSIELDQAGDPMIASNFQNTADFDPSANSSIQTSKGNYDIGFAKYSAANGSFVWAKSIGSTMEDYVCNLRKDALNNIYLTGYFKGSLDFDPSINTKSANSLGGFDAFFAKYNGSGDYVWGKSFGSTADDFAFYASFDSKNNLCLTGSFQNTVDFDPSKNTLNLTSAGSSDIFVAGYDLNGNYAWASRMGGTGKDEGASFIIDANSKLKAIGIISGNTSIATDNGTTNLTNNGQSDIFMSFVSPGLITQEINGNVFMSDNSTELKDGVVNLYDMTNKMKGYSPIETVTLNGTSGFFSFKNVIVGKKYLIEYVPNNTTNPSLIRTFLGNTAFWKNASMIDYVGPVKEVKIATTQLVNTPGTASVIGKVNFGTYATKEATTPISDVWVGVYQGSNNEFRGFAKSDASGNFSINNLQAGAMYKAYVHKLGYNMDSTYTFDLASAQSYTNTNFIIDSTDANYGIYLTKKSSSIHSIETGSSSVICFPNPSNGDFKLKWVNQTETNNAKMTIFNIAGIKVFEGDIKFQETIKTGLSAGQYTAIISNQSRQFFEKIVIE